MAANRTRKLNARAAKVAILDSAPDVEAKADPSRVTLILYGCARFVAPAHGTKKPAGSAWRGSNANADTRLAIGTKHGPSLQDLPDAVKRQDVGVKKLAKPEK